MEISHPFRFTCLAIHSGNPLRLLFQAIIPRSTSWRSIHAILLWLSFWLAFLAILSRSCSAVLSSDPFWLSFHAILSGDLFYINFWRSCLGTLSVSPFWRSFLAFLSGDLLLSGSPCNLGPFANDIVVPRAFIHESIPFFV